MKIFFTAKNYSGQTRSGELDVKNERDLATQLRAEGFIPTSFKEIKTGEATRVKIKILDRLFGISLKDKLIFSRNLAVMISSGLPLSRAIKNISLQTGNKRFSKVLNDIFADLQAGSTFADSLSKYPAIFNDLFVNMVRVGEASGNLEEVLEILSVQLEKEHDLMSKIRGAMVYPCVILVAMVGIAIIMLTYILPKLMGVFKDMQVQLPQSTRIVIAISDILRNYSYLVFGGILLIVALVKVFLTTKAGKKTLSFILINTPAVGNLVVKINCARFARIYSSLLRSGVSVVESLKIVSHTLTNYYYERSLTNSIDEIQRGVNLSEVIKKNSRIFPVLVAQMLEVGEETGKTELVLQKLAEFYEDEVNGITKNMSSIIEPVLMIIIGSAVGFFAVSMLQPMYSIMDNIK